MDTCVFCKGFENDRILYQNRLWTAILDGYPVSQGHTLLIPKRHCETYFDLNKEEIDSLHDVINVLKNKLDARYGPSGYNVGTNCGISAGQTVMHCHIHIIPRYNDDVKDPRGGVRGCIPSKMKY